MEFKIAIYLAAFLVGTQSSLINDQEESGMDITKQERNRLPGNVTNIVPDKYISGGHPARIGQFPYIARLSILDRVENARFLCAGSLIGVRHVLTAAHCVEHEVKYYQDIQIYLGEYDRKSFPQDCVKGKCTKNKLVYPDKIMQHKDYDSRSISNDIALLRLKKRAPLSEYIKIIPLPPFDVDTPSNKGSPLVVLGWGGTELGQTSNVLLTTLINLIPKKECPRNVPEKHLCAGDDKGRDTCPGDSGGPLLMYYQKQFYLSGIVSYGPDVKCGTSNKGYYTNVYKYKDWIKKWMKITH